MIVLARVGAGASITARLILHGDRWRLDQHRFLVHMQGPAARR